jgi:Kef-type K+ transport system membrane component KefB/mannitol/fructose-specific phosphotransferase system IIA component (Ntr-type)
MELSLLNLLLVLLAAWAGGAIAQRIGYPAVLGELMIGIVLGPAMLGLLGDHSWVNQWLGMEGGYVALNVLAQLGVLLLMLYIGMEIDPKELGKASWGGFLAAIGGFITPFVMGWGVVYLFRASLPEGVNPHLAGIFVGIAVGVTSLATKSRILYDLKILDTRIAHVMMAGALIADTLSLLIFAGVIGFAEQASVELMGIVRVAAKAVLFFGSAALVGLYLLPLLFKLVKRAGIQHRGIYFTLMLLIALAFGEAAHLAGLHAVLGTFVAGLFLREGMLEPKVNRELEELVRDVSVGFLAPIFFVMAGFEVSLEVFKTDLWLFLAIMAVAFFGKIVGTALFYLPTRNGWREGLVLGAGMNGRGAVEIILAGIALKMGLISKEIFSILVFMAIITTATVPMFLKWGVDWLKRLNLLVRSAAKRNSVLIVGATPTARALARLLAAAQPVWLIDSNQGRVEAAKAEGLNAVAGNALDTEALSQANAPSAALGLTMTTNAEINALAARNLRDVFMVPRLGVLVLGPGRRADEDALQHLQASELFGKAVVMADWDHWFDKGAVDIQRMPVPGATPAEILAALSAGSVLPLALEREAEGRKLTLPFTGDCEVRTGDILVLARAREDAQLASDRFDSLVRECTVLDVDEPLDREAFFAKAAEALAEGMPETPEDISRALHDRESMSSTILTPGLAVPHIMLDGEKRFNLLVVRDRKGVKLADDAEPVHALFVLAGSQDERNFHLKALSAIAQIWQSSEFESCWRAAKGAEELRRLLIDAPRQRIK